MSNEYLTDLNNPAVRENLRRAAEVHAARTRELATARFEQRVQQATAERDALLVDAGHHIGCTRCANEAFAETDTSMDARHEFHALGWRVVDGFQMCPECVQP